MSQHTTHHLSSRGYRAAHPGQPPGPWRVARRYPLTTLYLTIGLGVTVLAEVLQQTSAA